MKTSLFVLISMLCCILLAVHGIAVVYEPTWKGQVVNIDYEASIITVEIAEMYGCEYIDPAEAVCGFEAAEPQKISAEFSNIDVYDAISVGDPVIGKSYGGFESTQWSALAKIIEEDTIYIEVLFGDPSLLDVAPLAADYVFSYNMVPDCDACAGTICPATSASVVIESEGIEVAQDILVPGQSISYVGRDDGSGVIAHFFDGETSSIACEIDATEAEMMTGSQPVQNFSIVVVVPLGQTSAGLNDDSSRGKMTCVECWAALVIGCMGDPSCSITLPPECDPCFGGGPTPTPTPKPTFPPATPTPEPTPKTRVNPAWQTCMDNCFASCPSCRYDECAFVPPCSSIPHDEYYW
jgi:hypothetical protein